MTPLFLPEVDPHAFFEKQASIARMPDDDTKWPAHVLSNLHQQLPFLSQYEVNLSLQRVEPEAGFAFGHALLSSKSDPITAAEVRNPKSRIRIPIIVADRQLQPFHTFELEGNVYPLTSERVEAALLNPAMFDGPATKPRNQKSLIDQLYPPYQQRQGFGRTSSSAGMGVTKVSSAPSDLPSNPLEMTPKQLQTLAKLRKTEGRDRFEQSQGFLSRTGERLKSMAIPMGVGLTIGAGRGLKNRAPTEGILESMKGGAGRAAAISGGVGLTGGVAKEVGLRRRQKQRKRYGMTPVGTPEENPQESFKEAMVQMRFGSGNQVPASVVLRGNKFKTAPGVQPRMMKFYQIQGTPYVAGVPPKVAAKLEKAKDQKQVRQIISPLMREEVRAQRSGRPVQGMFLLFHRGSNGKYRFLPPSPMRGM